MWFCSHPFVHGGARVARRGGVWTDHLLLTIDHSGHDDTREARKASDGAASALVVAQEWASLVAASSEHARRVVESGCVPLAPSDALVHAVEALGVRSVLDLGAGVLTWLPAALQRLPSVLPEHHGAGDRAGTRDGKGRVSYDAVDVGGETLESMMPPELLAGGPVLEFSHRQLDVLRNLTALLPPGTSGEGDSRQMGEGEGGGGGESSDTIRSAASSRHDLVIVRGLLSHMRLADALELFTALIRSRAKYALVTSSPHTPTNIDLFLLDAARYRPINLLLPPFLPANLQQDAM